MRNTPPPLASNDLFDADAEKTDSRCSQSTTDDFNFRYVAGIAQAASIDLLSPLDVRAVDYSGTVLVIVGNRNDETGFADGDHVVPVSVFILLQFGRRVSLKFRRRRQSAVVFTPVWFEDDTKELFQVVRVNPFILQLCVRCFH